MNDYYDVNIKKWRLQEIEKSLAEHTDCTYAFYKDVLANKASIPINTIFQSMLTSKTNFYDSSILSWNPFLPRQILWLYTQPSHSSQTWYTPDSYLSSALYSPAPYRHQTGIPHLPGFAHTVVILLSRLCHSIISVPSPSFVVTLEACSPSLAYNQFPRQLLFVN